LTYFKEPQEFALIKATVREIIENYRRLFELDVVRFYEDFVENEPLVVFAVLMNKDARDLFLKNEKISNRLMQIIPQGFLNELPYKPKSVGEHTQGFWKDIEPKGKDFMIIRMEAGNLVRNVDNFGEELSYLDVNGKFPILDGILYKSNNQNQQLVYLPCSSRDPFWIKPKKE
jgi:hypothetical protein